MLRLPAMFLILLASFCAGGFAADSGGSDVGQETPAVSRPGPTVSAPILAVHEAGNARMSVRLVEVDGPVGVLEGWLEPAVDDDQAWHFYDAAMPMAGLNGLGRPTRIELPEGSALAATGDLVVDAPLHSIDFFGTTLMVYDTGPVRVRLPVRLPVGDGSTVDVGILVSWQMCTDQTCMMPVERAPVTISVPSVAAEAAATVATQAGNLDAAAEFDTDAPAVVVSRQPMSVAMILLVVGLVLMVVVWKRSMSADGQRQLRPSALAVLAVGASLSVLGSAWLSPSTRLPSKIAWDIPASVAETEQLIAQAHADGKAAVLDFTGPTCVNCQKMAKGAFMRDDIADAWNRQVPIEINTDAYPELAAWQQETFTTQARPLYVRLDPEGGEQRWDLVFDADDDENAAGLVGFLDGTQASAASGSGSDWTGFVVLALLGGLVTLVMPCTYPMIPFTVTFFSKQAEAGHRLVPLAASYAFGIIGFFVGIGVLVAGVFGASVAQFAGHWLTNLIIGAVFVLFAFSLLGAFILRLPAGLEGRMGGSRSGYLGALIMGATFAITAFTCTAPFAGLVLAEAVTGSGSWLRAVAGMAIYASAIAVPFFVLAISPGLLTRLPRAGGWMSEFKVVGGLVEFGAAAKFLVYTDQHFGWGVFTRDPVLAMWAALSGLAAVYLLGWIRLQSDSPIAKVGILRGGFALAFGLLALGCLAGLSDLHLGDTIEGFFPADFAPSPDVMIAGEGPAH